MLTNGLNMGLSLQSWFEKTVHGVETNWLSGKEKVPGTAVSKEDNTENLLGHERTHRKRYNCKQCFLVPIP